MNYPDFIVSDPRICGGEPVVKGTRVTVRTVLASLAEGDRIEEVLADFPSLAEVRVLSRKKYGRPRAEVEQEIRKAWEPAPEQGK